MCSQAYGATGVIGPPFGSSISNSTFIYNRVENNLHPPLKVFNYDNGAGLEEFNVDIGDGTHGVFDVTTYAQFSVNNDITGQIIVIDTDVYPELKFTNFILSAGWSIQPVGSNPLIIRSQSGVEIFGIIDCSGERGGDSNPSDLVETIAGQGRCSGRSGGNGGTQAQDGQAGVNSAGIVTGGGGATGIDSGGGGGGAFNGSGLPALPGNGATAGAAGVIDGTDLDFTNLFGASGGGGGSRGSDNTSGAAGGAGGGVVLIIAKGDVTIYATGSVLSSGGDGGDQLALSDGGGGGAGGGGSIAVFSAGNVTVAGNISAVAGIGGSGGTGAEGGNSAEGRTWVTDFDQVFVPVNINPGTLLIDRGFIKYQTGNFVVAFNSIDTLTTGPTYLSHTINRTTPPGSSDLLEFVFDTEPNIDPSASWANANTFINIKQKRYLYSQVTVTSTDVSLPVILNSVSVVYDPNQGTDFDLVSACGVTTSSGGGSSGLLLLLPIFCLMVFRVYQFAPINN